MKINFKALAACGFFALMIAIGISDCRADPSPAYVEGGFVLCDNKRGYGFESEFNEGYKMAVQLPKWEFGIEQCDARGYPLNTITCVRGNCAFIPAYNKVYFLFEPDFLEWRIGQWEIQIGGAGLALPSKDFILNCDVCFHVRPLSIRRYFKRWPNTYWEFEGTHTSNGEMLDKHKNGTEIPTMQVQFPGGPIETRRVKNPGEDRIFLGIGFRF